MHSNRPLIRSSQPVYEEGAGLIALGVKKGDNMAFLSRRPQRLDHRRTGHVLRRRDERPAIHQARRGERPLFRLVHADVKYIMVSGHQLKKIRAIKDKLPFVRKIIVLDELPEYKDNEISLSEIRRMGKEYLASHPLEDFLRRTILTQQRLRDHHLYLRHDRRPERCHPDPPQLYGERGASAHLRRYRRYVAHISNTPTRPLFRARGRILHLHVEGSIRSNRTSRTYRYGNLKEHPDQHKEFKPYLILSVPAWRRTSKRISNKVSVRRARTSSVFRPSPQIGLHL